MHILVTSRKEPDIEAALDRVPLASEEKIDLFQFREAMNHDMDIYLQQKLGSPEFDNVSEDTKLLARSLLLEKADGMYAYEIFYSYYRILIWGQVSICSSSAYRNRK